MMQCKVVILKLGEPSSLVSVELLRLFEVLQIGMVGPDLKGLAGIEQILPELFQGNHDGQEFPIINLIVVLGFAEGLG